MTSHKPIDPIWNTNFILACLASLFTFIAFYFLMPTLPFFLKNVFGLSNSTIGLVLATYTVAALIIRPFSGYFLDLYARKPIYVSSLLFFVLMFGGYMVSSAVGIILVVRFLHGLTWGITTTSGSTLSIDLIPPRRRGEGVGYYGLFMTIAMAIGPVIGLAIYNKWDYRIMFLSSIGVGLLGLICSLFIKAPTVMYKPEKHEGFTLHRFFDVRGAVVSVNMLLSSITYGGVVAYIAVYGKELGIENSGLFFFIMSLGIGLSRISSGRLIDQGHFSRTILIGLLAMMVGFPILALIKTSLAYHLAAFPIGLGFGILMPSFQTLVINMAPLERRGAANSTFLTAFDLGIGIGMVLIGHMADITGFSTAFFLCGGINLVALLYFVFISSAYYQKHKQPI